MARLLARLFQKLPEGSPSLRDAYRMIVEDQGKQVRAKTPQGYALSTPLKTQYGTAVTSGEIGDMFRRAQEERNAGTQPKGSLQAQYEQQPIINQEVLGASNSGIDYTTGLPLTGHVPQTPAMLEYRYTKAPEVTEGFPQDMADKISNYIYSNTGNKSWLDQDYMKILWNEINQQNPDLSVKDKQAFLRTAIDIAFAESHLGADYRAYDPSQEGSNRNRRNANAWNMNFNSTRDYANNYDPDDRQQMADYLINQLTNTFNVAKNRGLSDRDAHNYHIGYNAPYSQEGVNNYRGLMGGSNTVVGDMYRW